ncbi:MAG: ABC transporter substrate-binding protein [Desulfamplus sp.]|nr:ABC transporter substrate-binding protein [Desulfamplus sp.]
MYQKKYKVLVEFISILVCLLSIQPIFWSQSANAQTINDLILMTENYPPFNFLQDEKLQGISVDLIEAMLKKTGSDKTRKDIQLLPWARGYYYLEHEKNACLFATTRTEEREKEFKWVGPIAENTTVLTSRKKQKIDIKTPEDLKKYKIGAVIKDIGEQLLLDAGLSAENIDRISGTDAILKAIKRINMGRIDAFAYGENVIKWELKQQGFDLNDYETAYVLKTGELYYAFHKDTPDDIIQKLQNALDELKKEGDYQRIRDTYLK